MLRRLWQKLLRIWKLAKSERASPREIGWAVALGVLAACTPAIGFHGPLALGLATLFKKNRLFSWIGSRISNVITLPFIVVLQIQVAHRLRTGEWVELDREHILDDVGGRLLDWCLGIIPVGGAIAALLGLLAYAWAARRATRPRVEPQPPSSESRA